MGLVRGVRGLRGVVRVEVLSDDPARFAPGSTVFPEGTDRTLSVVESRPDGPGLLVRFAEVPDRNAADELRDVYLEAEPQPLPEQSWYWHEIIGCRVVSDQGEDLGIVEDVFRVGEAEVYTVRGERGELLVPAISSVVLELAPPDGRIVVDGRALGLEPGAE